MRALRNQIVSLIQGFLLSVKAIWSLTRSHKVHTLYWFVLDFNNSIIFRSIEYFILLMFKFHRWFVSWVESFGLL